MMLIKSDAFMHMLAPRAKRTAFQRISWRAESQLSKRLVRLERHDGSRSSSLALSWYQTVSYVTVTGGHIEVDVQSACQKA